MDQRFFPYDKNYILKQVQQDLESDLLTHLIQFSKIAYHQFCNPLGLNDDTSIRISSYEKNQLIYLHQFYVTLSGVYRYKFGDNQLEFLWDGKSHYEKYAEDWREGFVHWTKDFCQKPQFLKAVLAATVFCKNRRQGEMAENRLKIFINSQFEVKMYKKRGLVAMKVA